MVTIERPETNFVGMRAWPDGNHYGPTINSDVKFTEDTVRVQGAVSHSVMQQLHSGLSHTNYTSCIGIAKGVPAKADTDAARDWAAQYIPVVLEL